jgi:polyisoprenyl-teichoic acid--peptidoglycan teichoic acid transferase
MKQHRTLTARAAAPQAPDRLTRALTWVAILLAAVVITLAVDLWLSAGHTRAVTHAIQQTPLPAQAIPSATATASPVPVTPPPCVPPQDWSPHTVKEGDTLYSLSQFYGTDVETLKQVNCLDADTLLIDQKLYVPVPTPAAATATETVVSQPTPTFGLYAGFPQNFVNIILLGSDKRADSSTWRTDTLIVLSVDTKGDFVRLLSIPRDLWVNIPGHGEDRINTADLWGELAKEGSGAEVVKQTIYESLGIPIHYYVRADFQGFIKIIDAVGGVDVDVECPLPDIELAPGMHHMDGEDALLYARSRITTSDFDRGRRQRKVLMALWQQGMSKGIIPKLPALWLAMKGTFQTDLPLDQVIRLGYIGLRLKPDQILSQSIGPWQVQDWVTPGGAAVLLPLDVEIKDLLTTFYAPPDIAFLERIERTRIQVLNGSQRQEADQMAATSLRWTGFMVTTTGLADSQSYTATQIIVHNTDEDVAETVAQQLDAPRTAIQYQLDPSSPADIVVILGSDYDPCGAK